MWLSRQPLSLSKQTGGSGQLAQNAITLLPTMIVLDRWADVGDSMLVE